MDSERIPFTAARSPLDIEAQEELCNIYVMSRSARQLPTDDASFLFEIRFDLGTWPLLPSKRLRPELTMASHYFQKSNGLNLPERITCRLKLLISNSNLSRPQDTYHLLPSFHKTVFENAWHWQDVYCERFNKEREGVRVRLLEPVCQLNTTCALH